jgi:MFS family permease
MVVSGYLLFRKLCSAIISVFSGWLSDKFGVLLVFKIALVFVLGSLLFILTNHIEIGIVIAFLFNSVIVAMLTSVQLKFNTKNKLTTLTSITTWWDIGSGTGTLFGLFLIQLVGYHWLFGVLFGLLLVVISFFFKKSASFSKPLHL